MRDPRVEIVDEVLFPKDVAGFRIETEHVPHCADRVQPVFIDERRRDLYHAALASAANHLVTLVVQAGDLLRDAGVADPARMLGPLLSAALDNALRLGDAALTGPVARGDAETVASHIEALAAAAPQTLPAYLALARLTADRALAAGTLKAPDAQRLLDVLSGSPR